MRAALTYQVGDARVGHVADPALRRYRYRSARPRHSLFGHNITLRGGPAPACAYSDRLLPSIVGGRIEPGLVFSTVDLDGYRAMDAREDLKVLVRL
ncbi:hypothetical protein [Streptomyces sp. Go40/10]|uniref:hypothetical protein n=1 Tax=Streptomyces sp. Go40/10 TaxID=2825844 RepID=UPI003FA7407C